MSNRYIERNMETTRGYATLLAMLFFLSGSVALVSGIASPVLHDVRLARSLEESRQSHALAEGLTEDVVYRLKNGIIVGPSEELTEGGTTAAAAVTDSSLGKQILSTGDTNDLVRKVEVVLTEGDGIAFAYGVQADTGGIIMENNSSILGNVYSNGTIVGQNKNNIYGDAVSAGGSGLVEEVHATGTIRSHSILNSIADKDAYYDTVFQSSSAGGTAYSGSPDQSIIPLPITDEKIEEWKNAATSTVISEPCPYEIDENATLGPVQINCDVIIRQNPTVTINGAVWVIGDLTIKNSPVIRVGSSVGDKSVPIIVDNPSNRTTGSKVSLENSPEFQGSPGSTKSYILIVSQNESAKLGGNEMAIDLKNEVGGDLLIYAGHGEIVLQNNSDLKEVSGYRIRLKNFAQVVYETGLGNTIFQSGPTGGFSILSWEEVE